MGYRAMLFGAAAALAIGATAARADEADARRILQEMSDYLSGLAAFSFDYDSAQEVVTTEGEKIGLAQSGTVAVARPDRIHATRLGGFVDLEMAFDGSAFSLAERDSGLRTQIAIPGGLDALIDALRDTYGRPLPAADLLVSDPFAVLMDEVSEVKDLGSGVIGGVECDHLAFRGAEVDWQIWIAQGAAQYPCLFVITSRDVDKAPQYRITIRDWRESAGDAEFALAPAENAREVDLETFAAGVPNFPAHFTLEAPQ